MQGIEFEKATITVATAAKVLGMDAQTVRLLLQNNLVNWGKAYRLPGSKHYSYLIYAKAFYEATGFVERAENEQ